MVENKNRADLDEIKRLIPHRYPFLFIDKVENIINGKSATGIKNVTVNEPHFEGHFPTKAIMPGVLIVESMAQTAAILVSRTLNISDHGFLVYFMSIENAKFRKLVQPGDVLYLEILVKRNRSNTWKFSGNAFVEKKLVAEANFTAMMVDK
tara:strand:- start:108 stop:560 length:453 start_codon:yes stop_codon:yes gene_type:complete